MSRFWSSPSKKPKEAEKVKGPEVRLPEGVPPADGTSTLPTKPGELQGDQLAKFNTVLEHQSQPDYVLPATLKDLRQWRSKQRYDKHHQPDQPGQSVSRRRECREQVRF